MRYSLAASIGAGCGLGVVGTLLVRRARAHDPKMIVYAFFPVVFSIHQLIEGVNWYALARPFAGGDLFLYLYSIIAFGFWPICIPLAAAVAEERRFWRPIWSGMVVCGAALAIYLWKKLAFAEGFEVSVVNHSLAYKPLFDDPPQIVFVLYVALTVLPSLLFPNRAVKAFGWLVLGSFALSVMKSRPAWYSVWCMAAAVFSLAIAFAIRKPAQQC